MSYNLRKLWVIIPVGGHATRLLPLTAETSKASIRMVNRPLIEISLLCLARQGIRNFVLGVKGYTNYRNLHDLLESGVGFSARYGFSPRIHIKYQPNIEDCGSGDSTRINLEYYNIKESLFAVQGDNIFDEDIGDFLGFHKEMGGIMTIGLRQVKDITGYGVVKIDKNMRITGFVEKPQTKDAPSNLVNTGLYVFTPEIRKILSGKKIQKLIARKNSLDIGYDVIPHLIEEGYPVYGHIISGNWYDVGTPKRYLETMYDILHGKIRYLQDFEGRISEESTIWIQGESPVSIQKREEILKKVRDGRVELKGTVLIGRHCQIGNGTRIVDSCIDNYTIIGRNVTIKNSSIMDRVSIGDGTTIEHSIIGRHVVVESTSSKQTRIENVTTIADDVIISSGCKLVASNIYPHNHVPEGNFEGITIRT